MYLWSFQRERLVIYVSNYRHARVDENCINLVFDPLFSVSNLKWQQILSFISSPSHSLSLPVTKTMLKVAKGINLLKNYIFRYPRESLFVNSAWRVIGFSMKTQRIKKIVIVIATWTHSMSPLFLLKDFVIFFFFLQ